MADAVSGARPPVARLILIPAFITLAVTILRVAGELKHWSRAWFNPEQGGGGAVVGIVWLVPIFGVYFALKLIATGERPKSAARGIALAVAGCLVLALGFYLFNAGVVKNLAGIIVLWTLAAAGAALQLPAWRALFKVLAAYGYAARIPVAIVMAIATWADWQSHYSTAQPGISKVESYISYGLIPQLVWWVSFTIVVGSLFGTVAAALATARQRAQQAA
jgi:hypothetical protein